MSTLVSWLFRLSPPLLLVGMAMMAAGFTGMGWSLGRTPLLVQLARQSEAYMAEKKQLAEQAAQTLQAAQDRGDALTTGLLNQQTRIDKLKTEAHHAITQVTTGKPCLGPAALRLLDSAPGLGVNGLPTTTGGAAAADGRVALDSDIAGWAVDAGAQYEVCRARLDALIDFYPPAPERP